MPRKTRHACLLMLERACTRSSDCSRSGKRTRIPGSVPHRAAIVCLWAQTGLLRKKAPPGGAFFRSSPVCAPRHTIAARWGTLPGILVRLPERLQSDDRVHALSNISRQAWRVLRGIVGNAVFGHTSHFNGETFLDPTNGASRVDAGAVVRYLCDLKPLFLQPGHECLTICWVRGILLIQFCEWHDLPSCYSIFQVRLRSLGKLKGQENCHLLVAMFGLRRLDHQAVVSEPRLFGERSYAVLKYLSISHDLPPCIFS